MNDNFNLKGIFEDDGEICCNFTYKGKKFSLWWSSLQAVGAFAYEDSVKAQAILQPLSKLLDKMILENKGRDEDEDDYRHTKWGFLDYGFGN
jgi:hypothetical protein